MAGLGFAREQLQKQGWKEGKGLGKEEHGITKAIKVGMKNDTQGVTTCMHCRQIGYKISDQFTFHWWDHVFNKAAKSIVVKENEDGIQVSKSDSTNQPISNKRPNKHTQKPLLYGRFVKASASTVESSSDSDSETHKDFSTGHAEDIVFKACGGRTAHKGARHGLKLNGKLKRIEEHDRIASSEPCSRSGSPDVTREHDIEQNTAELHHKLYSDSEEYLKKKKKKKKRDKTQSKVFAFEEESKKKKTKKLDKQVASTESEDLKYSEAKKDKRKRKKASEEIPVDDFQLKAKKKKKKKKAASDEEFDSEKELARNSTDKKRVTNELRQIEKTFEYDEVEDKSSREVRTKKSKKKRKCTGN